MQAGLLRDFVTIEDSIITRDRFGAQVTEWRAVWNGRAWVKFSSGTQIVQNGETYNTITRKVEIRNPFKVSPRMRLKIGDDCYRILSIDDSPRDYSKIMTVELIND